VRTLSAARLGAKVGCAPPEVVEEIVAGLDEVIGT